MGYKLAIAVLFLGMALSPSLGEEVAVPVASITAPSVKLPVGNLGDPAQLRFEGVKAFPEEQLRRALAGDLEYQAAARPSADLSELVRVLGERLEEGYGKAGIRAEIDVRIDDAPVVVVKEGTPKRFGHFGIAEDSKLPSKLLERVQGATHRAWTYRFYGKVSASDTDRTAWAKGKPFQFDRGSIYSIGNHLCACYADLGLFAWPMPVDKPSAPDTSVLNAILEEVGPTDGLTLARIDIHGLTRHSREELLDYLGIAVGDPLHYQTLERVCERLDSCHRFWMHKVDVYLPKPPGRYEEQDTEARLVIRLVEYEEVPKLGEPLSEVDVVMLRAADWLAKLDQSEYDVVVSCTTPENSAHFIASLATNAYCVDVKGSCQFAKALDLSLDHTLLVEPGKLSIIAWDGEEMCVISGSKAPVYSLSLKPSWDHQAGKPSACFESGLGLSSKEKACSISIDAMPVLRHGRESSAHRFENGVLTLVNEDGIARIDQLTGRLLSFDSNPDATQGVTLHIETARGAFERRAEEVRQRAASFAVQTDQQHEIRNLLSFALRYFAPSQFLTREQDKQLVGLLRQAIESPELIAWLEERQRESKEKAPAEKTGEAPQEFVIPAPFNLDATETSTTDDLLEQVPALADLSFVRGSWPWTAVREVSLAGLLSKQKPPTMKGWYEELQRLAKQEENGPLFHLSAASWLIEYKGLGAKFAQQGLERLDEQFLRNDLTHFTEGDLWGAKAVEKLAELATQLNDEQRNILLSYAPLIARAPLEAVLTRRAERPEEPPREAIVEAVLEAWRGGWREEVERELQAIAGPVPRSLPTQ